MTGQIPAVILPICDALCLIMGCWGILADPHARTNPEAKVFVPCFAPGLPPPGTHRTVNVFFC